MIGWLRGSLLSRGSDGEVLIDVGGVGYRVSVPTNLLSALSDPGETVEVFVHTHVREDAIILYGFATVMERRCFEALLGAHGVGPSLALAVMSSLRPDSLVRAVMDNDLDLLCAVPGIGKKTAARLVIDLKSKLDIPGDDAYELPGRGAGSEREDIRGALTELGYAPDEIRHALGSLPESGSVEELLRHALRELALEGTRR
ncbi:MAG: Holliday junction branch migration protein RuvA [Acidimicrobiales bacterium]|jgi:Holliday junction DNA helicase RuvA